MCLNIQCTPNTLDYCILDKGNQKLEKLILWMSICLIFTSVSCSNKKNTALTRAYHSINTRYNVHFNANEAYKEALKSKEQSEDEAGNMTQLLHIYPMISDSADLKYKGRFGTTIDKTTKAIKLHSINTRPRPDRGRMTDPNYRQWLRQKEFNPFLVNTWMLLAKGEFQEGNYLRAITTFMHVSKIYAHDPKVVSECKLWISRAYAEMGWMYEAEDVLRKMEQTNGIHPDLMGMYASVKANVLIRNGNYADAIPYLEKAVDKEKKGSIKRRKRYLLGQLYAQQGENQKAYQAFGKARGLTAPYKYTINSKLRQIEVADMNREQKISALKKLTKGIANEDYLDQVYTVMGDVYISEPDTLNAIKNYALAIEKSKKDGYDKALAQIKLGGLYFQQKEYVKAQPCYSEALPKLKKSDEHYPLVALRSEVLDQLVVHAKVVQEQDSLLLLANMPEAERLAVINKHIDQLKKEEEKKKREEQRQQAEESRDVIEWGSLTDWNTPATNQQPMVNPADEESDFYFYKENTVTQGKIAFQKNWGRRPLEDNWRRKDKASFTPFGDDEKSLAEADSLKSVDNQVADLKKEDAPEEVATDIYSVEYYLQQLPLTDEAKQAAYKLIDNGLFNMGLIYKNLLEDNVLAIGTFEENLNRFPTSENREEIYYQLFLIYLKAGVLDLAANCRNQLISSFPDSKYAVPLRDPNYAWNFTYMGQMQEEMYQQTYDAYFASDVATVRRNYNDVQTKYPFVSLMPKFALLNALTYALTKDAKTLEKNLSEIVADYPQSDVVPLATNILKNIKDGHILLSDGTPISGIDWTMVYENDSIFEGENAKVIEYLTDRDKPYVLLLMFEPNMIDRNELLYEVADYNFSNYVIQTFDLSYNADPVMSALEIKGFKDFKAIGSYLNRAMDEEGLLTKLDANILPVPISANNYADMYPRLGLEEYIKFYTDSLSAATPRLQAYWDNSNRQKNSLAEQREDAAQEDVATQEEAEKEPVIPLTGEEKINFDKAPAKQDDKTGEEQHADKEVNLEDVLSKEQVAVIGTIDKKTDDIVEAINMLGTNPVEGLKNIFNRNKIEDNLTKEEKEELKRQEKEEKARQKEQARVEKARQDSIIRIEKQRTDSVKRVQKAVQDSIQAAQKAEQERIKQERQAVEMQAKQREENRKHQLQEREDARKQQQKEREERRKEQERLRDQKLRQREAERKQKEKEAEHLRKQRERERKELLKQRRR